MIYFVKDINSLLYLSPQLPFVMSSFNTLKPLQHSIWYARTIIAVSVLLHFLVLPIPFCLGLNPQRFDTNRDFGLYGTPGIQPDDVLSPFPTQLSPPPATLKPSGITTTSSKRKVTHFLLLISSPIFLPIISLSPTHSTVKLAE